MDLETKVLEIISKNIEKKEPVSLRADLRGEIGLDSLAMLMIVSAIEDEFDLTVPEAVLPEIRTAQDMIDRLKTFLAGKEL